MVSLVVLSSLLFMQGDRVLTGPLAHGQQVRPAQVGDLASFWAAGRMFLSHQNPYDPELLAELADQHDLNQVFVTTNPPILLPIVSLLAIVPFPVACTVWFVGQLVLCYLIMLSICQLVERHWFGVARLMVLLPATWDCMLMGQWSLLVLLGVVRCERCLQRDQPLRAGLWLALVALKPHLVMVYLLVLAIESLFGIRSRAQWSRTLQLAVGFGSMLLMLSVLATLGRPTIWAEYLTARLNPVGTPLSEYHAATIGSWLVASANGNLPGLAWLPMLAFLLVSAAMIVGQGFAVPQQSAGINRLAITLLVSLLVTPYAWHYDQVLLLPMLVAFQLRASSNEPEIGINRSAIVILLLNWIVLLAKCPPSLHALWPILWAGTFWYQQRVPSTKPVQLN